MMMLELAARIHRRPLADRHERRLADDEGDDETPWNRKQDQLALFPRPRLDLPISWRLN